MTSEDDFAVRASARVTATADRMSGNLVQLSHDLYAVLAGAIPELQGDHVILEMLRASIEGNLATIAQVVRLDLPAADIHAPP
ncbi:MAG: hypothetical protein EOO67_18460, partial [Microbacterium sp.]